MTLTWTPAELYVTSVDCMDALASEQKSQVEVKVQQSWNTPRRVKMYYEYNKMMYRFKPGELSESPNGKC